MPISTLQSGSFPSNVAIDTNTLVVDGASNLVGVGTSAPSGAKLEIFTASTAVDGLKINRYTPGNYYSTLRQDNHGLAIHVGTGGTVSERVAITPNGITFNGETAAANALDDYEEGLWNPTFVSSNGGESVTYDVQKGGYVKVGRLVHIQIQLGTTSVSGGSGYIKIGNLPFANDGTTNGASAISIDLAYSFASTITGGSSAQVGDSFLYFYKNDNAANVWNWNSLATGSGSNRCWISGTYITS